MKCTTKKAELFDLHFLYVINLVLFFSIDGLEPVLRNQ